MQRKLYTVWIFARTNTRAFFRDRLALFFGLAFPLIFLFIFGGLFGRGDNDVSFRVALINESQNTFAGQFEDQIKKNKVFKIDDKITTTDAAREKMTRGQLDATIVLPTNFGEVTTAGGGQTQPHPAGTAKVLYTQNNAQAGQTLISLLDGVFKGINGQYVNTQMPFTVQGEQLKDKSLSQFDYTFAGLLGFAVLGLGLFGPMNVFPELKKQGILRRLHTTPLKVWQYFVATALSQAFVGLVSIALMFAVAMTLFGLRVNGNLLEIAIWIVLGIITILGIGLAIGGWARNERQAAPLGQIIAFPLMFLSGTFFPRFIMPEWLQNFTNFLPLTPVIDGVRLLTTEGKHIIDLLPQLGLMVVWLVVVYIIAFRVFRWE